MRRLLCPLILFATALATLPMRATSATPATESPDAKAARIESQLTDDERFQLLHGIIPIALPLPDMPEIPPGIPATAGFVRGIPRLGIPDLRESDAGLGVTNPYLLRQGDTATALPATLALAASFDLEAARRSGVLLGTEARARGFNVLLAGGVNLARDPRNGRNFEYFGEDPLLAGRMAGEVVAGIQSQGVISTVKHFALNDQETHRNTLDARIDEAALRGSDLLAFELAIERGRPGAVMCAYNLVNGDHACGSDFLLNQVLKRDWGYPGWVMSDWGAVYSASYLTKGLDQQSGEQLDKQVWFDRPLRAKVEGGSIPRQRVSDAVRRILRSVYAVGADRDAGEVQVDYAAHAATARASAAAGIVLLKNDGILPLADGERRILVVGGHADLGVVSGGGSSQVIPRGNPAAIIPVGGPGPFGPAAKQVYAPSAPLKALRQALPSASIDFDSGYDAVEAAAAAQHADVAIIFATRWQTEGTDSGSLSLPEGQDGLIERIAHANPNTLVVLETGNPTLMPWLASVRAVLEAWYPGQQGGEAIADVLSGAVNPSGHLPLSFPADLAQTPRGAIPGLGDPDPTPVSLTYAEGAAVGYRWLAAKNEKPLFPFGFGLSYTSFATSGLAIKGGRDLTATLTVKNTGSMAGSAVPQLYLVAHPAGPDQRLVAFARVALQPGEERTVSLPIDPRLVAHWDATRHGRRIDRGTYVFAAGFNAGDLADRASLKLEDRDLRP